jgi:hypothetical protein
MKKHLTTILSFAMIMLMAFTASFTLTSCGEEVDINGGGNPGKTVFSAGTSSFNNEDGTRTLLDKNLVYYWQFNDQIWVNDGGTWLKSSDSELSPDSKSARFYYDKLMTGDSYEIVYTGLNSTSATQVTIPASFTVSSNNDMRIGERGDCGVATATRQDGIYQFALQHKGSYLGIAPLKTSYLNKGYRWTKIEITDVNGKPIAGTFGFGHTNGIDTTYITSRSSTVTITLSENINNAPLQSYNSEYNYIFVVIPPCHRELHVKYYFIDPAEPENVMTITKKLNPRKFFENNVVTFRHGLSPEYYRWDAPKSEPFTAGYNNANLAAADFAQSTNACATMPNPNEMAWYVQNGDPRWDNTTQWTIDGGASYYTGGVWIKKKANITGFSSTVAPNGKDLRTEYGTVKNTSTSYVSSGKPANTSQYFFLPALGMFQTAGSVVSELGVTGYYWSSFASIYSTTLNETGYYLGFDSNNIKVGGWRRGHGCIAGKGSDWFK